MRESENILLIWDRMGDYHRARWRELQAQCSNRKVYAADLFQVDTLYQWENTSYTEGYLMLTEGTVSELNTTIALNTFSQIIQEKQIGYVCIPGYGRAVYLRMLLLARQKGVKVLLFAESWYPGNRIFDKVKGKILNLLVNCFLVSGLRAEQHFNKRLYIPSHKILKGYSAVDHIHFNKAQNLRNWNSKVLLCIARYAEEKNLFLLLKAFKESELVEKGWHLHLVGDGPLRKNLEQYISENNLQHHVSLEGWKSYTLLPDVYAQASCFILPSTFEPWGLVVNEAMASHLPVIVSDAVGCLPDLIDPDNGWSFPANDVVSLSHILNVMGNLSADERMKMGNVSAAKIEEFNLSTWAKQIRKGFEID